jgi:hypothetical protein
VGPTTKEGNWVKPTKIKDTKCQPMERGSYCLKVVLHLDIDITKKDLQIV